MNQFINQIVTFGYDGQERNVLVENVKVTKEGKTILVGRDAGRNDTYRSCSAEKIQNIQAVPTGWDRI